MKKIVLIISVVLLAATSAFSQSPSPGLFNYQGVARNSVGNVLINKSITLRLTIHDGTATGATVYQESRGVTTNPFGLFNAQVGSAGATNVTGTIAGVNWGTGTKYIQVEIDPNGGTSFINIGTAQLASVPYALYASSSYSWSLAGNSGTNTATNFIGTTDNTDLVFKRNNVRAGLLSLNNTSFGVNALISNTTGTRNTANGGFALSTNTTGSDNTANGREALFSNTTGSDNTANGTFALYSNTTGSDNIANGSDALYFNTTGSRNIANGSEALRFNTTGNGNTANGNQSLYSNTTGSDNTANGAGALNSNTTGNGNSANGAEALNYNTTGSDNTASGVNALRNNTSGDNNTANGRDALYLNTTGISNTANGLAALYENTTGSYNTANGRDALYSNITGNNNTANGRSALFSNTTGIFNTANGAAALYDNTTGDNNTADGLQALSSNTTGNANTANGGLALRSNTTGSNNTALGHAAFFNGTSRDNSTALGYNTVITASNQVRVGNGAVTSIGGFANWTNLSDGRFKTNIKETIPGLSFIMKLRPVSYYLDMDAIAGFLKTPDSLRLKSAETEKGKLLQTGFVAQEVEQAAKQTNFEFSGIDKPKNKDDYYGLRYAEFVVPLVKAVQEQQQLIEILQKQVEAAKAEIPVQIGKLSKQNEELLKRIEKMESFLISKK